MSTINLKNKSHKIRIGKKRINARRALASKKPKLITIYEDGSDASSQSSNSISSRKTATVRRESPTQFLLDASRKSSPSPRKQKSPRTFKKRIVDSILSASKSLSDIFSSNKTRKNNK